MPTVCPAQMVNGVGESDKLLMDTVGVTVGVTVNGTLAFDAIAVVLVRQAEEAVVTVRLTDCSCATELAVVVKLLPVPTLDPFIVHW